MMLLYAHSVVEAHAWRGREIVLFVTFEIEEERVRGTLGLPAFFLENLTDEREGLRSLFEELNEGDFTWISKLESLIRSEISVQAKGVALQASLQRIDLIMPTRGPADPVDQERAKVMVNTIEVEAHTGTKEAAVIVFEFPLKSPTQELQFIWRSKRWFVQDDRLKRRSPSGQRSTLSSKVAPGVLIDQEQITPLTFTPEEPEIIWRSTQRFKIIRETTDENQNARSSSSWWDYFFGSSTPRGSGEDNFKALHQGIYRAFEHETDEEIYDSLSESLEGKLLDEIFEATFRSLIYRDEGGARAQVTHVIPLKLEALTRENWSPALKRLSETVTPIEVYRYQWRLGGKVTHWGHTHRRVIDYEAVYAISQRTGEWRIVAYEPRGQTRRPELEGGP